MIRYSRQRKQNLTAKLIVGGSGNDKFYILYSVGYFENLQIFLFARYDGLWSAIVVRKKFRHSFPPPP